MKRYFLLLCLGLFVVPAQATIHLPTNRAAIITVGPLVDYQDAVTPEAAMTVTNITCCFTKDSDAGGAGTAPTIVINTTLTASGGSNDMVHLTGDTVGLYSLELTAAQLNFVGRGILVLSDPDVMCPWFKDIVVEPNDLWDMKHGTPVGIETMFDNIPEAAESTYQAELDTWAATWGVLSNTVWTDARAAYLDNINNSDLATITAQTGDAYDVLTDSTYGLEKILAGINLLFEIIANN